MNVIKNRIEKINQIHAIMNQVIPLLRADIEKNGVKFKTSVNELFAKDKARLESIYKPFIEKGLTSWINVSKYSNPPRMTLEIKGYYQVTDSSVEYFIAYGNMNIGKFDPFPIYDVQEMIKKDKQALESLDQVREIESKARSILYITRGR